MKTPEIKWRLVMAGLITAASTLGSGVAPVRASECKWPIVSCLAAEQGEKTDDYFSAQPVGAEWDVIYLTKFHKKSMRRFPRRGILQMHREGEAKVLIFNGRIGEIRPFRAEIVDGRIDNISSTGPTDQVYPFLSALFEPDSNYQLWQKSPKP